MFQFRRMQRLETTMSSLSKNGRQKIKRLTYVDREGEEHFEDQNYENLPGSGIQEAQGGGVSHSPDPRGNHPAACCFLW